MADAYEDCGDQVYLDSLKRCSQWYLNAQRADGGLLRNTYIDFKTDSFGHATSGILCAAILWQRLYAIEKDEKWMEATRLALSYGMDMQFTNPADHNLQGCILEKVLPPKGSDASPYRIRDLASIFFIQAACRYLRGGNNGT